MLIVPLKHDKIETHDGEEHYVMSYSNLREQPSIYDKNGDPVYFEDIASINGVEVEYDKSSKVFKSLGTIRRKFNIPQIDDILTVKEGREEIDTAVSYLRLHSKKLGLSKGLWVCDNEDNCYTLTDILDLEVVDGGNKFNRKLFLEYYKDYLPIK